MYIYLNNDRPQKLAEFIVENKCTVRACAAHFGISKSTVHKDVSQRLENIDLNLFEEVKKQLNTNRNERHIRGGKATKEKYMNIKRLKTRD